jgi:hypothetical protein
MPRESTRSKSNYPRDVAARARTGAAVRVSGTFVTRQYVERGAVRIFRVSRLEDASAASASPAGRLSQLTVEQLNAQQKTLADEILKVSSVGLGGPYNLLLRSPELGRRMFALLDYLRFNTSVPRRLNEFAILIQARLWTSQVEWLAHYPLALKAGIAEATLEDLKDRETAGVDEAGRGGGLRPVHGNLDETQCDRRHLPASGAVAE